MCGITAYIGSESAFAYIYKSLLLLQNRGYDSAGICTINSDGMYEVQKFAGTDAMKQLELSPLHGRIGIGHTRWATHGAKTDKNAHPHFDMNRLIAVVHNGIIENYLELRTRLQAEGYTFTSTTDTEVIPNLIAHHLKAGSEDTRDAIQKAVAELEGTWALVIMDLESPHKLYMCKKGSPLVIGYSEEFALIASEQLPLSVYFEHYITLNEDDIVCIEKNASGRIVFPHMYTKHSIENKSYELTPAPYPHWTLKEIYEQPKSLLRAINERIRDELSVNLAGLDCKKHEIVDCDHFILLGCGTSLNAAQTGAKLFREFRCFQTVSCYDASEFTLCDVPTTGKTGFLVLSQSGETKDVHRCMEILGHGGYPILAVVNVVGSLIARESVCGVYLNAGREVGVASTKSFTSQLMVLTLIAIWFAQNKDTVSVLRRHYISHMRLGFEMELEHCIAEIHPVMKDLAARCSDVEHMFILGRDKMKYIADEGALKIKEISYIHAESYAGGALKHGPFALLDEHAMVILLAPHDTHFAQMMNAAEEIRSRNARVVLITNTGRDVEKAHLFETVVRVPENPVFQTIFQIIPLQLLAYECAVARGLNPDLPKNLAKVVTVDG